MLRYLAIFSACFNLEAVPGNGGYEEPYGTLWVDGGIVFVMVGVVASSFARGKVSVLCGRVITGVVPCREFES